MLLNLARSRALMAERGLDALVAASPEDVIYASDFTSWTVDTFRDVAVYAVVPRAGDPALVCAIDGADYLAGRPAAVARHYTYGTYHIERAPDAVLDDAAARLLAIRDGSSHHGSATAALVRALRDCGAAGGAIGVDERGLPPGRWDELAAALPGAVLRPASDLFRAIRLVKTAAEVTRLADAARAVEEGMRAAFRRAAPGATELDLERAFRATVAAAGAAPGHFETTAGTRSAASFPASDYRIRAGDIVRADCGGRYRGYWADTGRTVAVGAPPTRLARYYAALAAGIDAILAAVRPGVAVDTLFATGVETVRAAGIPHYRRHHVGHGIGLDMYEAPLLAPSADDGARRFGVAAPRLEAGMVVNVELPYYELGLGGLQIEETLVVRDDGYELLTGASRDLLAYAPAGEAVADGE
ncbi:MAG TPA: Xaa-Pro peptidase family protein [Thermomicrobiales bacterium]|nr:Xaa-Pro peptidase family protein [Thermomicrobiales bacterium]